MITNYSQEIGNDSFYKELEKYHPCSASEINNKTLKYESMTRCRQSKKEADVSIALIGDSHAEHLFFGIAKNSAKNVAVYLNHSFPFSNQPDFHHIDSEITSSKSITTIIFGVQWNRWYETNLNANHELSQNIINTASLYQRAGKKVLLIADIPMHTFSAERCKYTLFGIHRCTTSLSSIVQSQLKFTQELSIVQQALPDIQVVSLNHLFCDAQACSMSPASELLYRDEGHLNIDGSLKIGRYIYDNYIVNR